MKYICLGYIDEEWWNAVPENERNALMDECFTYDDVLRKNGHFAGGEALASARDTITLRWRNGKVSTTDGPFTETKEQIGGILVLEARDLNHAIQLMSKHPGVKAGPFEIRPVEDLAALIAESERRRKNAHIDDGEIAMQYLLMCCFDEKRWEALPESQRAEIMTAYQALEQDLVKSGHYRAGAKLKQSSSATSVRLKNGKLAFTDGPFAETKEQIGGYHLLECRDLDEAIAIAMRIPTLPAGGAIEVRPVEHALQV